MYAEGGDTVMSISLRVAKASECCKQKVPAQRVLQEEGGRDQPACDPIIDTVFEKRRTTACETKEQLASVSRQRNRLLTHKTELCLSCDRIDIARGPKSAALNISTR